MLRRVLKALSSSILFVVIACSFALQAVHSEIVYKLIDGAAGDQSGHSLSGFITFNTPCGTSCTAANVTNFSFSVTGVYNYGHSYNSPADVVVVNGLGHLNVSTTSIALSSSSLGQLALGNSTTGFPYVQWVGGDNHIYRSLNPDKVWVWFENSVSSTIAVAIPEPTACVLALGGCLGFAVAGRGKRR